MDTLGHTNLKHAELYTNRQIRSLARAGLGKVTLLHAVRKKGEWLTAGEPAWRTAL